MNYNELNVVLVYLLLFVGVYFGMKHPDLRLRDIISYAWNNFKGVKK